MAREIELTQGRMALVDDEDFGRLIKFKWHAVRPSAGYSWYAARSDYETGAPKIRMHREILEAATGLLVDHINGDGLDNRRKNLRFATQSQNMHNRRPNLERRSSQYKGVRFLGKGSKPWLCQIKVEGRTQYVGTFTSEVDAALAYDAVARTRGEFASLNFPEQTNQFLESLPPHTREAFLARFEHLLRARGGEGRRTP